jgi:hypothetical protein
MLSWIFIVLTHWNNSQQEDMSLHSDTLSWLWAYQSLLLLLCAMCSVEKQQIQIRTHNFSGDRHFILNTIINVTQMYKNNDRNHTCYHNDTCIFCFSDHSRNILGLKIIIISTIVLILIGNNIDINLYNVLNGLS